MKRLALWILTIGLTAAAPASFAQEPKPAEDAQPRESRVERTENKMEEEEAKLVLWKWANFVVLAGAIVYLAAKHGGPFFAARSMEIRKEMTEAGAVRKDAEERAAAVDRRLANLSADVAPLLAESIEERRAEAEELRRFREVERARILATAQHEIESAQKAARLELRRYAASLAVESAERKIRARMTGEVQNMLVGGFVRDLESPSSPVGAN
jgi:F-type H+-transporting ATPase subunit b